MGVPHNDEKPQCAEPLISYSDLKSMLSAEVGRRINSSTLSRWMRTLGVHSAGGGYGYDLEDYVGLVALGKAYQSGLKSKRAVDQSIRAVEQFRASNQPNTI